MIWSLYAMLGRNMRWVDNPVMDFEDEAWDAILESCQKNGLNQIVLDVGEGLQYKCYPELAREGAWSHERARAEVARCREMGIELIPKLNFSATHHMWLGEYRRMMSTRKYYEVCENLIKEVHEAFYKPRYFHIGMDEEGVDYVEEAAIWQAMTHEGVKAMNDGYSTVPTPSNWGDCEWCHDDVVEHFVNNNKSGKLRLHDCSLEAHQDRARKPLRRNRPHSS